MKSTIPTTFIALSFFFQGCKKLDDSAPIDSKPTSQVSVGHNSEDPIHGRTFWATLEQSKLQAALEALRQTSNLSVPKLDVLQGLVDHLKDNPKLDQILSIVDALPNQAWRTAFCYNFITKQLSLSHASGLNAAYALLSAGVDADFDIIAANLGSDLSAGEFSSAELDVVSSVTAPSALHFNGILGENLLLSSSISETSSLSTFKSLLNSVAPEYQAGMAAAGASNFPASYAQMVVDSDSPLIKQLGSQIMTAWAEQDFEAAGNFLNSLPKDNITRDWMIVGYTIPAGRTDPTTVDIWINEIRDPKIKLIAQNIKKAYKF